MGEFWILILVAFFATNALDKAESVQLEELPLQTFNKLFLEEWWDKDEAAEELKTPAPTNFGQNVHHQIDRQNTKLDKLNPIQLISLDKLNPIQLIRILLSQNKTVAKGLGLSDRTIYKWKSELGQTRANKYAHNKQKEFLMERYYEIKDKNPKISDEYIAKILSIGSATLNPNSVDGHFVKENAAANVQEIGNSNSGSI
uniref:Uncharacterized protein n=1 Tax=Globodera rostochiensis TaxID=31243 RepID=A0A914HS71_GLORO